MSLMTATVDGGLPGVGQAGCYHAEDFVYQISGAYRVTSMRFVLEVAYALPRNLKPLPLNKISWPFWIIKPFFHHPRP
jgi:hypothetical protein